MTAWSKLRTSLTYSFLPASQPLPLAALTARLPLVVRAVVRQMARAAMGVAQLTTSGGAFQAVHSPPG
jgi:hypothetical protein